MGNLPERIQLVAKGRDWLNTMATQYHYMHRPVHPRATPFGWGIEFDGAQLQPDGAPSGFIVFSSIHYTKLRGEFGYEGLPTKWQVLSLSRLWLHDNLPRNSETVTIGKAMRAVQKRWLEVHPPVFWDQPYEIRKVISYSDTRYHQGTIYKAANFREYGKTKSRARHDDSNTRGVGSDGAELVCYIYDLPERRAKEYRRTTV
jgi:hypothetical protein